MTSNAGARLIGEKQQSLGFGENNPQQDEKQIKAAVEGELKKIFRPEFLNRIDETVIFNRLTLPDIEKIARLMLAEISDRLKKNGVTVRFSENTAQRLAEKGFNKSYGARNLRRLIINEIENPLSEYLLNADVSGGREIVCSYEDGSLSLPQ